MLKNKLYKYFLVTLKLLWVPQGDTTNLLYTRSIEKYFEIRFAIKPVTILKKKIFLINLMHAYGKGHEQCKQLSIYVAVV